jgi:putative ABC transport system permease protein
MSFFRSDLRPAYRALTRSPLLTGVAILTLALSIGLNTAMFSVVDAVVLRPLPFERAERLVALCEHDRGEATDWCGASVPDVFDVAQRSRTIAVVGVARSWPLTIRTREKTEGVEGGLATAEAFRALGVEPLLGRLIEPEDAGASWKRVAVLSHELWQDRFGGRTDIVGQSLTVDDEPHTVVGVLPPGVRVPLLERVRLWRPVHVDPRDEQRRDWRGFQAFGRLAEGATVEQAEAEVAALAGAIQRDHFPSKPGWSIAVQPWQDVVVGAVRRSMYVFAGAVGLVLLIGCANVANLLLAQATARERELAVHAALGASRSRLVRRLLTESMLLAVGGCLAGLLLGWWAARLFVTLAPSGIPRIDQVGLDARVLAFTALAGAVVTILVGVAPALRATRIDPHRVLIEGGRSGTGRRGNRIGEALIVGEIALAVVLVTGAGLLVRSFATQLDWNPGFEQDHLLTTWTFSSPGKFQSREQVADFIARAEDALRTIPAVTAVASGSAGPLFGGDGEMHFTLDGQPEPPGASRQVTLWYDVSPDYFATLGLPIVRGRSLATTDRVGTPLVGVINETFARRFFAGDPLGHLVRLTEHDAEVTVVGVVRDVPPVRPDAAVPAQLFWSNRQIPRPANYYLVRVAGDPAGLVASIKSRLEQVDPDMQISATRTMGDWLRRELVRPRFGAVLLGTFGALALGLAAVGIYGLLAYTVAQRTREIGIRVALGARSPTIVAAVLRRGLALAGVAIVVGVAGAIGLTRVLRGMLAGVEPTDPVSFVAAVVVLVGATTLACVIPARRASRVDPMVALRAE